MNSTTNVCIYKMEITFDKIISLLNRDYSKCPNALTKFSNIQDEDKKFMHKWIAPNGRFDVKQIRLKDTNMKYIRAYAEIEVPNISINEWVVQGKILPRDIRIHKSQSLVLFVEKMASIYCIIIGSKTIEGKIRSNLMKTSTKRIDPEWGKIEHENVAGYKFDRHFYYWLLKNKGNLIKVENRSLRLNDVKGFKSNTERTANSYTGEGSNIDSEIPLKSLVSMNEELVSLYVDILVDNKLTYNFFLDYNGRLSIYKNACGEFATDDPKIIKIEEIVLDIYFDIIPLLLKAFNIKNSSSWTDEESNFKKKLSVDVIIRLIQENGIKIEEIEKAGSRI